MAEFFDSSEFDNIIQKISSSWSGEPSWTDNIQPLPVSRGIGPSSAPVPKFNMPLAQHMLSSPAYQIPSEQRPPMGFLGQAAHDIWTGVKQGVFSEAGTLDSIIGALVKTIDPKKFEEIGGVNVVRDLVSGVISQPTEADMHEGLKSMVFRGLGQAVPIIAEFVLGTKGLGAGMKAVGLPSAVKLGARIPTQIPRTLPAFEAAPLAAQTTKLWGQPISEMVAGPGARWLGPQVAGAARKAGVKGIADLAGPAYFAGRENITTLAEGIEKGEPALPLLVKTAGRTALGAGVGGALSLSHLIPGGIATRAPAMGGIFAGQTAIEGGTPQDILASGIVGAALAAPEIVGKGVEQVKRLRAPHQGKDVPPIEVTESDGKKSKADPAALNAMRLAAMKKFGLRSDITLSYAEVKDLLSGAARPKAEWLDSTKRAEQERADSNQQAQDNVNQKASQFDQQDWAKIPEEKKASVKKQIIEVAIAARDQLEYDKEGNIVIRDSMLIPIATAADIDLTKNNPFLEDKIDEKTGKVLQKGVMTQMREYLAEPLEGKRYKEIRIISLPDEPLEASKGPLGTVDPEKYGVDGSVKVDEKGKIIAVTPETGEVEAIWGKLTSDDMAGFEEIEARLVNGEIDVKDAGVEFSKMSKGKITPTEGVALAQRLFDVARTADESPFGEIKGDTTITTNELSVSKAAYPDKKVGDVITTEDGTSFTILREEGANWIVQSPKERIVSAGEPEKPTGQAEAKGANLTTKQIRALQKKLIAMNQRMLVLEEDAAKAKAGRDNIAIKDNSKRKQYDSKHKKAVDEMTKLGVLIQEAKENIYGWLGLTGKEGLPPEWKTLKEVEILDKLDTLITQKALGHKRAGKKLGPSVIDKIINPPPGAEEKKPPSEKQAAQRKKISPTVTDPKEAMDLTQQATKVLSAKIAKLVASREAASDPGVKGQLQAEMIEIAQILKLLKADLDNISKGKMPRTLLAKQIMDYEVEGKVALAEEREMDAEKKQAESRIGKYEEELAADQITPEDLIAAGIDPNSSEGQEMLKPIKPKGEMKPTGVEGILKGQAPEQGGPPPGTPKMSPEAIDRVTFESQMREKGFRITKRMKTKDGREHIVLTNYTPAELARETARFKQGGPEPRFFNLYVDLASGEWELARARDGKVRNNSKSSSATIADLPEAVGRIVYPASAGEKAKLDVKGIITYYDPRTDSYFVDKAAADGYAEYLNNKAIKEGRMPTAHAKAVDVEGEPGVQRKGVVYLVEEAYTGNVIDTKLSQILKPEKDVRRNITIELPTVGGDTVTLEVPWRSAREVAKKIGGEIPADELEKLADLEGTYGIKEKKMSKTGEAAFEAITGKPAEGYKPPTVERVEGSFKREPMRYPMPAEENIWGRVTSTIEEIINGNRTSTTRAYWHNGVPKVGDLLTFYDDKGRSVNVRVTSVENVPKDPSAPWLAEWSRTEGWTIEAAKKHGYLKGQRVRFELVKEGEAAPKPAEVERVGKKVYVRPEEKTVVPPAQEPEVTVQPGEGKTFKPGYGIEERKVERPPAPTGITTPKAPPEPVEGKKLTPEEMQRRLSEPSVRVPQSKGAEEVAEKRAEGKKVLESKDMVAEARINKPVPQAPAPKEPTRKPLRNLEARPQRVTFPSRGEKPAPWDIYEDGKVIATVPDRAAARAYLDEHSGFGPTVKEAEAPKEGRGEGKLIQGYTGKTLTDAWGTVLRGKDYGLDPRGMNEASVGLLMDLIKALTGKGMPHEASGKTSEGKWSFMDRQRLRRKVVETALDNGIDLMKLRDAKGKSPLNRALLEMWNTVYGERFGGTKGTLGEKEVVRRDVKTNLAKVETYEGKPEQLLEDTGQKGVAVESLTTTPVKEGFGPEDRTETLKDMLVVAHEKGDTKAVEKIREAIKEAEVVESSKLAKSTTDGSYRADVPGKYGYVVSFDVKDGKVVNAAPRIYWLNGKPYEKAVSYLEGKKGKIEKIAEPTGVEGISKGKPFEQPGGPPPGSRRQMTPEELDRIEKQKEAVRAGRAKVAPKPMEAPENIDDMVRKALGDYDERDKAMNQVRSAADTVKVKIQSLLEERKMLATAVNERQPGFRASEGRLAEVDVLLREALKLQAHNIEAMRHLQSLEFGVQEVGKPFHEGNITVTTADGKPWGASIISVQHDKGTVFHIIQGPNDSTASVEMANTKAGAAYLKRHTRSMPDGTTQNYLRLDGWSLDKIPEEAQDTVLNTAIEKNMYGEEPIKVERKPGVADDAWQRRKDDDMDQILAAKRRRVLALKEIKEQIMGATELNRMFKGATEERDRLAKQLKKHPTDQNLIESMLAQETLVDSLRTMLAAEAERGPVKWTKEQRNKYLEEAIKLNESIDPTLMDIDYEKESSPKVKFSDLARITDLVGDPTRSKHPTVRRIANYGQQYELAYRQAYLQYMRFLNDMIGIHVKDDPQKNKELMWHLHKVHPKGGDPGEIALANNGTLDKEGRFVSTDPNVLKWAEAHKTMMEDLAQRFELLKKGIYNPDYATIRYDMNKIWNFFRNPLELADSYEELPDSAMGAVNPAAFADLKEIANRYKGKQWDQIDPESQQRIKQSYLKWTGAFAEWEFLPSDLQQIIPKEKWVEYFQPRTAGESLKFALTDDYLTTTQRYLQVALRGAMYNEFLSKAKPLLRTLPHKNHAGTWGHLAESYVERLGGYGKESWSDIKWNALADSLNKMMASNKIPYYVPSEAVGLYREALYRGALGPDTALRNLTQTMFTWAEDGTLPVMKGLINFLYGAYTKSPEYKSYREVRDLLEENFWTEMQALRKSDNSAWQRVKDLNHRLTWLVLSPLRLTENINKGIAYFSGLESARKNGVDFRNAHLLGTRNVSQVVENLERTELEWNAWQKMGKSQFLYGPSTTSPYLQSNLASAFWPFLSFPFKSIQMLQNGLKESYLSKEWGKMFRFLALTGFLATAPYLLAQTLGIDAYAVWGKGAMPIDIMPMWYNTMRDIYTASGGNDGDDFMSKQLARDRVKQSLYMLLIPQYRWARKTGVPYEVGLTDTKGAWQRLDDKYTRWGRTESPLTDTNFFAEIMHVFGWPFSDRREGRMWMRESKDISQEYQYTKSKAVRRILDLRADGKVEAANNAMKMAREQGIMITGEDISSGMRKREVDAYTLQAKSMPKHMQGEWRKKAEEMKRRMINRKQRAMWGGEREADIEEEKD